MDITFRDNIKTNVPTCCLIEDYWTLQRALKHLEVGDINEARDEIECAMECIEEAISRYTIVPESVEIKPTVNSAISMEVHSGIITDGNKDLRCRAGKPMSDSAACACFVGCPYAKITDPESCFPENGRILLENGVVYEATEDKEEFLDALD